LRSGPRSYWQACSRSRFSSLAPVASASGLAGLADAHAASLAAASLAARGELDAHDTLLAISAALGANTAVKVVLAFVAGGAGFGWRFTAAIAGAVAAFGAGLALGG
jgi:uncharacterized membrane protein (DUF4010 family)